MTYHGGSRDRKRGWIVDLYVTVVKITEHAATKVDENMQITCLRPVLMCTASIFDF